MGDAQKQTKKPAEPPPKDAHVQIQPDVEVENITDRELFPGKKAGHMDPKNYLMWGKATKMPSSNKEEPEKKQEPEKK